MCYYTRQFPSTRFIEKEMGDCGMAWECEQCEDTRCFEGFHPKECDFNFCPGCGRRITEFVDYVEPEEGDD